MPPFRVVARHPDKDHSDHAWAQVAGLFDYADDAQAALKPGSFDDPVPQSLDPDEPIRPDPERRVQEAIVFGYELKAQELVVKTEGDGETPSEHKWKDVK